MSMPFASRGLSRLSVLLLFFAGAAIFVAGLVGLAIYVRSLPAAAPAMSGARLESPWSEADPDLTLPHPKPIASRAAVGLKVYFTANGRRLSVQTIDPRTGQQPIDRLKSVLRELLNGPVVDIYRPTVPPGTHLLGAWIVDNRAVVDLSGKIGESPWGGPLAEMLCVYAIVNTVAENTPGVREVQILVDGKQQGVLWRDIDISSPLRPDPSLIAP